LRDLERNNSASKSEGASLNKIAYDNSVKTLQEQLRKAKESKDDAAVLEIYRNLIRVHSQNNNIEEAITYGEL
jgi:hypothetical protein